jgi:hypothetical protein
MSDSLALVRFPDGRASRSAGTIVDGLDARGMAAEWGDPTGEAPRPVHDGQPTWLPADWLPNDA